MGNIHAKTGAMIVGQRLPGTRVSSKRVWNKHDASFGEYTIMLGLPVKFAATIVIIIALNQHNAA